MRIITKLRKLNIELTLQEGKMKVNAPSGVMNASILEEIKLHKQSLIDYLTQVSGKENFSSISKVEKQAFYPLSSAQRQIFTLNKLNQKSLAYNMPKVLKWSGRLDFKKLADVFTKLIERHESLRTSFLLKDDIPVQVVHEHVNLEIERYDILNDNIDECISSFLRPFDLTKASLFRVGIAQENGEEGILMVDMHHIIADGVSQSLLIKDFIQLYEGHSIIELPVQPKDYAAWQSKQQAIRNTHRGFWMSEYATLPEGLELPADFSRPAVKGFDGTKYDFSLDKKTSKAVYQLAEDNKTSLFNVLLTIYYTFLNRLSGQEDLVVGVPVAGRDHDDLQQVIGMFVKTLPLRNIISYDTSFEKILKSTAGKVINAIDNQSYSYEDLINELNMGRDASRNPLFDTIFVYENYSDQEIETSGLVFEQYDMPHTVSKFDLSLEVRDANDQLHLTFEYRKDLFLPSTIARFTDYLTRIISAVANDVSVILNQIEILSEEEKHQLIDEFNSKKIVYSEKETLISLFEHQVFKTPARTAIKLPKKCLSYYELESQANKIANYLSQNNGVCKGDLVGVALNRGEHLIPVIYGIMKAGAAYVPIDPSHPKDRIKSIMENARLQLVITTTQHTGKFHDKSGVILNIEEEREDIDRCDDSRMRVCLTQEDLAYVIYTSGSTGVPKGVAVKHGSVFNIIKSLQNIYPLEADDCYLMKTTYTFDVSVTELFGWFHDGGSIYMLPATVESDSDEILAAIADGEVTHINFAPSMFGVFLNVVQRRGIKNLSSLKYIFLAGEALPLSMVKKFNAFGTDIQLENIYGPTEGTIYSCRFSTANLNEHTSVPIGKPLNNVNLYILSDSGNLQPVGTPGELCIGGKAIAAGYLYNDALTAEKFIDNPVVPGEKIYKTGDLTKWNLDGNIEYLGRLDNQVKIRGYRIELSEIESILGSHPDLKEVLVIAKGEAGDKFMVGYYVADRALNRDDINNYLRDYLPDYMIPSYWVQLEQFPLTPNSKVDRKSLPNPLIGDKEITALPKSQTEKKLAKIWSSVLKLDEDQIDINTSFFELGGNSLRATVLANKIFENFRIELLLQDIFRRQSIQELGTYLDEQSKSIFKQIPEAPKADYYPVSSAQKRLYFLYEFDQKSVAYNLPQAIHIEGDLDKSKLELAIVGLIERHESLRTYFEVIDGNPVQKIGSLSDCDFSIWYTSSPVQDISTVINDFVQPFDLSKPGLIRVGLIQICSREFILIVDIHHIITDGVSQGVLVNDFMQLYQDHDEDEKFIEYKDFAVWQQSEEQKLKIDTQKSFWLKTFEEEVPVLELPTDYPRPQDRKYLGDTYQFDLDGKSTNRLKQLADKYDITLFMLMLAIYKVLLRKLCGQEDVVVGVPVSGRQHADLDNIIGMFVNTLPIRNVASGDLAFSDFLASLKDNAIEAFENQAYPYEALIDDLKLERGTTHNPLFDAMFVFENFETSVFDISDLTIQPYRLPRQISKFDLSLEVAEDNGSMMLNFEYSTELFKRDTIIRFASYLVNIVDVIISDDYIKIADIDMISMTEQNLLIHEFNHRKLAYPSDKNVRDIYEEVIARHGDELALVSGEKHITYDQLDAVVTEVAYQIHKNDLQKGDTIAIFCQPGAEMIVGILAAVRTGCKYVTLSIDTPHDRNAFILDDCDCKMVLTDASISNQNILDAYTHINLSTITPETREFPAVELTQEDVIYIIYTSGTTGKPKGVEVKHKGIVNMLYNFEAAFDATPGTKMSQVANPTFDASAFEILNSICLGATLYIAPDEARLDPNLMKTWLVENEIEITYQTTALSEYLLRSNWAADIKLRVYNTAGDRLNCKPDTMLPFEVYNLYGPTEDSIWTTSSKLSVDRDYMHYSIGTPIANKSVYILDKYGKLQPMGVAGELCIGGDGLAKCYINNNELTKLKFVDSPFEDNEQIYKTGDLARWLPNGEISFVGRIDDQVKIRGYRIELGEIESRMLKYDGVDEAVVVVRGIGTKKILVAYFVGDNIETGNLKRFLLNALPEYMVPVQYHQLDSMPVRASGKIDRDKLPVAEIIPSENYEGASNEIEECLVEIWSDILDLDTNMISINANFFELGGHSIHIINLSRQVKRHLNFDISVANMFRLPTIAMIADYIIQGDKGAKDMTGNIEESLIEVEDNINNLLNQLDD